MTCNLISALTNISNSFLIFSWFPIFWLLFASLWPHENKSEFGSDGKPNFLGLKCITYSRTLSAPSDEAFFCMNSQEKRPRKWKLTGIYQSFTAGLRPATVKTFAKISTNIFRIKLQFFFNSFQFTSTRSKDSISSISYHFNYSKENVTEIVFSKPCTCVEWHVLYRKISTGWSWKL